MARDRDAFDAPEPDLPNRLVGLGEADHAAYRWGSKANGDRTLAATVTGESKRRSPLVRHRRTERMKRDHDTMPSNAGRASHEHLLPATGEVIGDVPDGAFPRFRDTIVIDLGLAVRSIGRLPPDFVGCHVVEMTPGCVRDSTGRVPARHGFDVDPAAPATL